MFASKSFARFFVTTPTNWTSSKALLAKLRKKTGYTFANCKKALDKHNNDVEQAEKWLHEQAQALGWSKATNVGNRKTAEGMVAVIVNKNHGAMVELNCETDFVARNSSFQTLLQMIAKSCVSVVPQICSGSSSVHKELLDGNKLSSLCAPDGKTLADHVALNIGLLGENMTLKRAVLVSANENIHLSGYSHPAPKDQTETLLGKYGAIVATSSKDQQPLSEEQRTLSRQLCQHVVGMNPKSIGNTETDQPQANADDETVLIYQEYILDSETRVEEVLQEGNVNVLDFVRFECGETDVVSEEASAARAQA